MSAPPRPFPVAPLLAISPDYATLSQAHRNDLHRMARQGALSIHQADVWACRFGYHPSELWPEWWTT